MQVRSPETNQNETAADGSLETRVPSNPDGVPRLMTGPRQRREGVEEGLEWIPAIGWSCRSRLSAARVELGAAKAPGRECRRRKAGAERLGRACGIEQRDRVSDDAKHLEAG